MPLGPGMTFDMAAALSTATIPRVRPSPGTVAASWAPIRIWEKSSSTTSRIASARETALRASTTPTSSPTLLSSSQRIRPTSTSVRTPWTIRSRGLRRAPTWSVVSWGSAGAAGPAGSGHQGRTTQRKPMCVAEVSTVSDWRAEGR